MSDVGFRPTHVVPSGGLDAWAGPDATRPAVARLDGGLDVEVVRRWGAWAEVRCSNGWRAWVDGGALPDGAGSAATVPPPGPPSAPPSAPSAVPPTPSGPPAPSLAGIGVSPALVGGIVAAAGALLPWVRGAASENAFGVAAQLLVDQETTATGGFSIGWIILAAALTGCVVAVRRGEERIRRGAGGVVAGASLLYVVQVQRLVSALGDQVDLAVTDVVGLGALVSLAGGIALAFAPATRA